MADGTVIQFPEVHEPSVDWELFWQRGSDVSDRMKTEGDEDAVIVDTLVGLLGSELAAEDELDPMAFITGSEHENVFVRAAVASRINLLCLSEFEQGASLANLLVLDPADMVRSRVFESIEAYIGQSQSAVSNNENNRRMLEIFHRGASQLSQEVEQSAITRHPSGGDRPGGAA